MGKSKVYVVIAVIFLTTILVVFSWTGYYASTQAKYQRSSIQNVDPNPLSYIMTVNLYFADRNYARVIPEPRKLPSSNQLEVTLIKELIAGPMDPKLKPTIPPETNLIGVDVVENVAYVNFSRNIQLKHWGGTAGEMTTISSIVYTLTQLEKIDQVQILVEGERLETLLGHVYIFYPLTIFDVMIGSF